MKIPVGFGMLFVGIWYLLVSPSFAIDVEEPINPTYYQQHIIGKGFATSFFKSSNRLAEYKQNGAQIVQDVAAKGFKNLRLRCRADLEDLDMDSFLTDLEKAVDDCLDNDVAPIVSWVHHEAEAHATVEQRTNYVNWWTSVAEHLKNKNYRLSFNLFTELGVDACGDDCSDSLRENTDKYNDWTQRAVTAIRDTVGNNANRILILASPKKEAKGLALINETIYANDDYMMAEFHLYASGPNKRIFYNDDGTFKKYSPKYWSGDGSTIGQTNVDNCIELATQFTDDSGVPTYFGAWMAHSKSGELDQTEVINFVNKFVATLAQENIPWSVNELNHYYDTTNVEWKTGLNNDIVPPMDMSQVLNAMMPPSV